MKPGAMQFTLTKGANSKARLCVIEINAALDAS